MHGIAAKRDVQNGSIEEIYVCSPLFSWRKLRVNVKRIPDGQKPDDTKGMACPVSKYPPVFVSRLEDDTIPCFSSPEKIPFYKDALRMA